MTRATSASISPFSICPFKPRDSVAVRGLRICLASGGVREFRSPEFIVSTTSMLCRLDVGFDNRKS